MHLIFVLFVLFLSIFAVRADDPVNENLPLVGTDGHGHAFPGATVPFGMVQLSPDIPSLGWDTCSGYHYSGKDGQNVILGFSHTHLSGTGIGCLGDVLLMPTVGDILFDAATPGKGYASSFSHANEEATPGYYRVVLDTPGVTAELTATARCGFHKYTFPASEKSHIILDLSSGVNNGATDSSLQIENQNTVSGYRNSKGWGGDRAVYFVMQFSTPFQSCDLQQNGQLVTAKNAQGKSVKASFNSRRPLVKLFW